MGSVVAAFKTGALITVGFVGHKLVQTLLSRLVFDRLFGAPAEAPTPEQPGGAPAEAPAVSGTEGLQPFKGIIAGGISALVGIALTNMLVKDVRTKMLVSGGMAGSFLHTLLVSVLDMVSPAASDYLSGYSDSTAARLSAMYGLGFSIQPHYAPIAGMGEYFTEGMSGLGEYFTEAAAMGAIGNYGANPDIFQAAAGFGAMEYNNGNHISPSSDLERELTIAEAAAGVGQVPIYQAAAGFGRVQPYEANAGVGEYFTEAMSGLGALPPPTTPGMLAPTAVTRVPTADTWIPGTTDPALWAGVRGITRPQSASEMTPAGILQTDGGQGIFG